MHRLFVEKSAPFASESAHLIADLRNNLALDSLESARIVQRYDLDGLSDEEFEKASRLILSEPQVESSSSELTIGEHETAFAIEFLPGQFDQRADSAAQCVQILTGKDRPFVASAHVIILKGTFSTEDFAAIKRYLINPVDSHEVDVTAPVQPQTSPTPPDVEILTGFNSKSQSDFESYRSELGLAMTTADLVHTQNYFRDEENREPTITELRMLDTYWSDHCRHTTFMAKIAKVTFDEGTEVIENTYQTYLKVRDEVYGPDTDRVVSLMDIALMGMKELRKSGELDNLEISNEINAASIVVPAENGEEWLVQFKNETHNHPTEIEPFGGAATCLGGCIRDPLSGRSYVYQAMRVTGAADPRTPYAETIPGKLPQRKICQESAHGYSSYGNQIGLATGKVSEVYHPNYAAKRMEIGAVVAAAPRKNVFRGGPSTGDYILLIGGRTGRDGVGGATGSSKEHTDDALDNSAEVQKGDAPTERKIQRLFRNPELAPKIKICNDFGAGGVSVAIGEIADSIDIDLDAVPKKYDGLDGTELAISESQERMAICVDPSEAAYFIAESDKENLECVHVATVTDTGRLRMTWRGKTIVDLSRQFLDTNGVQSEAAVRVLAPKSGMIPLRPAKPGHDHPLGEAAHPFARTEKMTGRDHSTLFKKALGDLNIASQKGLGERFDSSVGAGTVLAPFGGKYQRTPVDAMVATLPFLEGHSTVCTHMSWGFNPNIATWSPFHGAAFAVAESVCRAVASGARLSDIRLTLQEYFPKLGDDSSRWGLPFAALLGAFKAQHELRLAAIGGKDSMSGTFNDIDVPPTLVSFALAPGSTKHVISPEFKKAGSLISFLEVPRDENELPDFAKLKEIAETLHSSDLLAAHTLDHGGLATGLSKMAFGNNLGAVIETDLDLHQERFLCFLIESEKEIPGAIVIGRTQEAPEIQIAGETLHLDDLLEAWSEPLADIYPETADPSTDEAQVFTSTFNVGRSTLNVRRPKVIIPSFPGTNSEYDSAKAFREAGAEAHIEVFRNLTPAAVEESLKTLAAHIRNSQILMLPGGFSAGDEPAGSGKFIATILRSPRIADAVMDLLKNRDGLVLGICNGFQALVKTGLVPYGEIRDPQPGAPTLTYNDIGRHIACYATTRIASNLSPWLAGTEVGDLHNIPFSHGEGKFYATEEDIQKLAAAGQIATQYTDFEGNPTMDPQFNPNGSIHAIEGITSPCGRVFGKMGHTERRGPDVGQNISGNKHQPLFKAGVNFFA